MPRPSKQMIELDTRIANDVITGLQEVYNKHGIFIYIANLAFSTKYQHKKLEIAEYENTNHKRIMDFNQEIAKGLKFEPKSYFPGLFLYLKKVPIRITKKIFTLDATFLLDHSKLSHIYYSHDRYPETFVAADMNLPRSRIRWRDGRDRFTMSVVNFISMPNMVNTGDKQFRVFDAAYIDPRLLMLCEEVGNGKLFKLLFDGMLSIIDATVPKWTFSECTFPRQDNSKFYHPENSIMTFRLVPTDEWISPQEGHAILSDTRFTISLSEIFAIVEHQTKMLSDMDVHLELEKQPTEKGGLHKIHKLSIVLNPEYLTAADERNRFPLFFDVVLPGDDAYCEPISMDIILGPSLMDELKVIMPDLIVKSNVLPTYGIYTLKEIKNICGKMILDGGGYRSKPPEELVDIFIKIEKKKLGHVSEGHRMVRCMVDRIRKNYDNPYQQTVAFRILAKRLRVGETLTGNHIEGQEVAIRRI